MFGHHLVGAATAAHRTIAGPILATALALATLGSPTPIGVAAAQPASEPSARLQVVVKEVTIHDDREGFLSGKGEMELYAGIWRCDEAIPPPCAGFVEGASENLQGRSFAGTGGPIVRAGSLFDASTGETVTLDREVPQVGDLIWGGNTSPQLGFAVYAGQHYVLQFEMDEDDGGDGHYGNEYMGYVFHVLDTEEHGLGLGTHTARSLRSDGRSAGDYTVTYEIRRTPLPDVEPVAIKVHDLPGRAEKRVCMAVLNREVDVAGPFEVALRVGNRVPSDGRYTVGLLAPGTDYLACVETMLPSTGEHVLGAVVDEPRKLTEFNEANNLYEQLYEATGPSVSPEPSPSAALPDLTVAAIKVNGRVPDGKDDCKDGRNDVTVVVKNQGSKKAGDFFVRLVADDHQDGALEQGLANLEAGKEATVRFKDVRLKKGPHSLAATADWRPGTGIAESNETNNTLKVAASCKDDD